MTLAELIIRVQTQIRAELPAASLSVSDLDDDSIEQWGDEELINVILILKDPKHFPELVAIDESLTFSSGSASLPEDFWWPKLTSQQNDLYNLLSLKVTANSVTKRHASLVLPAEFARFDSSNFVLTPSDKFPVATIADKVYIKPTDITAGYLDYITTHQAISSGTQFDAVGDNVLVALVMARYYEYRELPELQALAYGKAQSYGNK